MLIYLLYLFSSVSQISYCFSQFLKNTFFILLLQHKILITDNKISTSLFKRLLIKRLRGFWDILQIFIRLIINQLRFIKYLNIRRYIHSSLCIFQLCVLPQVRTESVLPQVRIASILLYRRQISCWRSTIVIMGNSK